MQLIIFHFNQFVPGNVCNSSWNVINFSTDDKGPNWFYNSCTGMRLISVSTCCDWVWLLYHIWTIFWFNKATLRSLSNLINETRTFRIVRLYIAPIDMWLLCSKWWVCLDHSFSFVDDNIYARLSGRVFDQHLEVI